MRLTKLVIVFIMIQSFAFAQANLALELVAENLDNPLFLTGAPGQGNRLYVVEQGGRIVVIDGGEVAAEAFLDLTDTVTSGGERGLLGLAFHPDFAENGFFFVN